MWRMMEILGSTTCPGTASTSKFLTTAAATVLSCTNAMSLPRQVRGPALKEANLYDGTYCSLPSSPIHRSGRNSRQSLPHTASILPIAYSDTKILSPGRTSCPLGSASAATTPLCSNGTGGYNRSNSHRAACRCTSRPSSSGSICYT
uniref:Uncharacterized protein n=1 Tax=Triticum urartu TaxID=4572 RepID=A0A8R7PZD7_TRIUA